MTSDLNSSTPMPEQIRAQAGQDIVVVHYAPGKTVTLTRKQADALLAGAQLVVDPLSGMFEVRP